MRRKRLSNGLKRVLVLFVVILLETCAAATAEIILFNFPDKLDQPYSTLIFDAAGNLYGTTLQGGLYGAGTVFELIPQEGGGWTETVLYNFTGGSDGNNPQAGVIFDSSGSLYGTTRFGGACGNCGVVFMLTPTSDGMWMESVIHSFTNDGNDGLTPEASLVFDTDGNLYGTTVFGGPDEKGTVFEVTPEAGGGWTESVLYTFKNDGRDGNLPSAQLIFDTAGNLYSTTFLGGKYNEGTVFELSPQRSGPWKERRMHNFTPNGKDGLLPIAGLTFDATGNLYGTTLQGGKYNKGTVYELSSAAGGGWHKKILHNFHHFDGYYPESTLIFDADGTLYGTTLEGGNHNFGTVFKLTPNSGAGWKEKLLYSFNRLGDGDSPVAGLIFDSIGNLYGSALNGGAFGGGTVFEITP